MHRIFVGVIALFLTLIACRAFTPDTSSPDTETPGAITQENTTFETLTPTPEPASPTATATASPTLTASSTVTHTPIPATATPSQTATQYKPVFEIRTHPDGGLYVGDQVSFEVIAPPEFDYKDETMSISEMTGDNQSLQARFAPFGIGGRLQATFYWGWDTTGLPAGEHPLSLSIQPLGYTWTHTVTLGSAAEIPPPEPLASWATDESECCLFYYISDTASAREITSILVVADELADQAVEVLDVEFTEPLEITLMPRVLGQGGFASNEIYISFLDRNYVGNSLEMVLQHEMVHMLDHRLGGEMRPTILIEGLAVYLTGGHYKPEALIPRAAALLPASERTDGLGLGWYLPLRPLSDDFYDSQHEIGYIQAGALVKYMVDTWGWEAYSAFYRDIHPIKNGTQSDALDAALQRHFDLTLDDLEADFLEMLGGQDLTPQIVDDVRLTVEFFDTMRRYQQVLDPSAYFLTAWLPDGPLMRENSIVADLVRRPSELENLALETLLVSASEGLKSEDHPAVEEALSAVNGVLDAIEAGLAGPFNTHPLAEAHFEIAGSLRETGYIVEQIEVTADSAQVVASHGWPELTHFEFAAAGNDWILVSSQ